MKNPNLLFLCITGIALCSCSAFSKKPVNDCSTVFEDLSKAPKKQVADESQEGSEETVPSECKVLKVKVKKDLTCEVSGSDSADKLIELYQTDNDADRVTLIAPLKSLNTKEIIENYETILTYYKLLNNVKDHVSSDLFDNLGDYKYKGVKCESNTGQKFVGWIGDGQLIASYKDVEVKNQSKPKATKEQSTKKKVTAKTKN